VGTAYSGRLEIYGNADVGFVMDEALVRLNIAKNGVGDFELNEIKEVFFGSKEANTDGKIGCRNLLLEEFQKCSGEEQLQYLIYFSTDSGYPDYFSKYLVDHLKIVDPKVKIILNCVGDGIYKVKEVITPSS
jgi:hypothetical protein